MPPTPPSPEATASTSTNLNFCSLAQSTTNTPYPALFGARKMATRTASQPVSLTNLPRELRDEILGYLALPDFVYTSSAKPNTADLHRSKVEAKAFVDTRIFLPCRTSPNVLGVCRQLREECLQWHNHMLASCSPLASLLPRAKQPSSSILAARLGNEIDEESERLSDCGVRVTLEAQRARRGPFGYSIPARDELSPRFLALLPLMEKSKKLKLVVWAGYDWWNGSRPRVTKTVNGRPKIDEIAQAAKPDAVSFAIGKVLERLPAVEELEVVIQAHTGEFSRWDLPDVVWQNIQYWLDGPIAREGGQSLKRVHRRLAAVWHAELVEAFYEQQETRVGDSGMWHVKRHGDMQTVSKIHASPSDDVC
jgi:hypothetical protein